MYSEQARHQVQIARDPGTEQAVLRQLFNDCLGGNQTLKEALASNPSLPPELLAQLVEDAPLAFCRNPIIPLLPLEMPDFMDRVSLVGLGRLLRSPKAPLPLVLQLAEGAYGPYLQDAARMHLGYHGPLEETAWEGEVWRFLWEGLRRAERAGLQQEIRALGELEVIPRAMGESVAAPPLPQPESYSALRARLTPEQVPFLEQGNRQTLDRFKGFPQPGSKAGFSGKRRRRGANPTLTDYHLMWIGLALRPDIPLDRLISWCDPLPEVARAVARNPQASEAILVHLTGHNDPLVRRLVICNPGRTSAVRQAALRHLLARWLQSQEFSQKPRHLGAPWEKMFPHFVALLAAPAGLREVYFLPLALSAWWEDRLAVALAVGNQPEEEGGESFRAKYRPLLEQLSGDGNYLVRAAARARLQGKYFNIHKEST